MPWPQKQMPGGFRRLGSLCEFKFQSAIEIEREVLGFALDPGTLGFGEIAEGLDFYQQFLVLKFVRPDARDCAVDEHYGRDPALVAVDALVMLRAEQVIFFAMSQQIGIENRQQPNTGFLFSAFV